MAPRSAEPRPAARVALVGATSPAAAGLRKVLENRRVPGSLVDLDGTTQGEAAISGYAGESRLILEPAPGGSDSRSHPEKPFAHGLPHHLDFEAEPVQDSVPGSDLPEDWAQCPHQLEVEEE